MLQAKCQTIILITTADRSRSVMPFRNSAQNYSNIKLLRSLAAQTGRLMLQNLCFYFLIENESSWNACQYECHYLLTAAQLQTEELSSDSLSVWLPLKKGNRFLSATQVPESFMQIRNEGYCYVQTKVVDFTEGPGSGQKNIWEWNNFKSCNNATPDLNEPRRRRELHASLTLRQFASGQKQQRKNKEFS